MLKMEKCKQNIRLVMSANDTPFFIFFFQYSNKNNNNNNK